MYVKRQRQLYKAVSCFEVLNLRFLDYLLIKNAVNRDSVIGIAVVLGGVQHFYAAIAV